MRESVPVHSPHRRTVRHLKICLHCLVSQPSPIPFNVKARTLAPPRDALIVVRMSAAAASAAAASAAALAGGGDGSAAADAAQSPPRAQAQQPAAGADRDALLYTRTAAVTRAGTQSTS